MLQFDLVKNMLLLKVQLLTILSLVFVIIDIVLKMIDANIKDLVKQLHGEQHSYRQIAHIANIPISSVHNIVKNN